ncbi:unnamed protein product, partial [Mesorhabditis spiculigera]
MGGYEGLSVGAKVDLINALMDRAEKEVKNFRPPKKAEPVARKIRTPPSDFSLASSAHTASMESGTDETLIAVSELDTESSGRTVNTDTEGPSLIVRCRIASLGADDQTSGCSLQRSETSELYPPPPPPLRKAVRSESDSSLRYKELTKSEKQLLEKLVAKKRRGTLTKERRAQLKARGSNPH